MMMVINGSARHDCVAGTVSELVDELGLAGKRIAVELNGDVVPRSRYCATSLEDGDRIEIVVAVGGG